MEIVAVLFTLITLAAIAVFIWWAAGIWGVLAFALLVIWATILAGRHTGPRPSMRRDTLNAFQQPLADDRD